MSPVQAPLSKQQTSYSSAPSSTISPFQSPKKTSPPSASSETSTSRPGPTLPPTQANAFQETFPAPPSTTPTNSEQAPSHPHSSPHSAPHSAPPSAPPSAPHSVPPSSLPSSPPLPTPGLSSNVPIKPKSTNKSSHPTTASISSQSENFLSYSDPPKRRFLLPTPAWLPGFEPSFKPNSVLLLPKPNKHKRITNTFPQIASQSSAFTPPVTCPPQPSASPCPAHEASQYSAQISTPQETTQSSTSTFPAEENPLNSASAFEKTREIWLTSPSSSATPPTEATTGPSPRSSLPAFLAARERWASLHQAGSLNC